MKESKIEKEVCIHANTLGWLDYKFVSPGLRGVPDRMFLREGLLIFIEFKTLGEKPSKIQSKRILELMNQGFAVYIIDDIDKGKNLFNYYERFFIKNNPTLH